MPVVINGSTGISGVDGSAGTPSYQGGDTNTGIFYPAADVLAFSTNGTEDARFDSSGNFAIGSVNSDPFTTINTRMVSISSSGGGTTTALNITSGAGSRIQLGIGTTRTALLYSDSTNYTALSTETALPLLFLTNQTERMRIDSSGRVGIGETNLSNTLTVSASQATSRFNSTSSSQSVYQQFVTNGISLYLGRDNSAGTDFGTAYATYLYSEGAYPVITWINGSERMRITSSGNVGIGTNNPGFKLQINVAAGADALNITDALSSDFQVKPGVSVGVCRVGPSAGAIAFQTDGTERMRLVSGGNLLVNTTSTLTFAGRLQVDNSGENTTSFRCTTNNFPVVCHNTTTVGTRNLIYFATATNTNVGTITSDGTGTNYNSNSDYRLKENITPMTGALAKVAQLKPCTYTWKSNGSTGQGFIAHELQAVVPDAVVGEKDAVDKDGNPVYQGIDTSFLVATLTAAIQEQQAMIEELKAKVAALEK